MTLLKLLFRARHQGKPFVVPDKPLFELPKVYCDLGFGSLIVYSIVQFD